MSASLQLEFANQITALLQTDTRADAERNLN